MKSKWLWDRLAGNWDKPGVGLGQNDIRILQTVDKYLAADNSILDYGCATGSIAFEIAGKVREVQGIDISTNMIEIAKRKAVERNATNVNFAQSTIFDQSFRKESFDVILALNILHLVEKSPAVLNTICDLLKPGGLFVSATPCVGERNITGSLIRVPLFLLSKSGVLPSINFFSVSGLKTLVTNHHFQIVETEYLTVKPLSDVLLVARKN